MNRISLYMVLLLCGQLLASISARSQGLYWESNTTLGAAETPVLSKSYAMPKMFKHESEGQMMIVRLDREMIYVVNSREKTYWQMSFAEMEGMMKQASAKMDAARSQMEESMKNMPPEQRKMMEQMMGRQLAGGRSQSAVDVEATAATKRIGGLSCSEYVATRDGKEIMTVWATRGLKEFSLIRKDWEQFNRRILSMNPAMGKGLVDAFQSIDGFPMEIQMEAVRTLVTRVESRSTPADQFEVPSGYAKVKPPAMGTE